MDIRSILDANRDRIIKACQDILKFETVSGSSIPQEQEKCRSEIKRCMEFLRGLCAELDLEFRIYDDRVAVIEHKGADKPILGIPSHIDVVPTGEGWTHPPFGGVVDDDGVLWGRGTLDDKVPLLESVFGMWAAKQVAPSFPLCCRVIVGTQEETGDWSDMKFYQEKEGNYDFGFTPDSDFPIINGEKGFYNPHVTFQWTPEDFNPELIGIPAQFISVRSGERANVVPDLAEITIECKAADKPAVANALMAESNKFLLSKPEIKMTIQAQEPDANGRQRIKISFVGKRAHSSTPWMGRNAAVDAMNFIASSLIFPEKITNAANFLYHRNKDMFAAGWDAAHVESFTGKNSVNMGVLDLNPSGGRAIVNFRPPLGLTIPKLRSLVTGYCEMAASDLGIGAKVEEPTRSLEALFVDSKEHPEFFEAMQRAYKDVVGETAELRAIGGTTYAKAFPNTVSFGPILTDHGEPSIIHQVDERVSLDAIFRNTEIYGRTIQYVAENLAR